MGITQGGYFPEMMSVKEKDLENSKYMDTVKRIVKPEFVKTLVSWVQTLNENHKRVSSKLR